MSLDPVFSFSSPRYLARKFRVAGGRLSAPSRFLRAARQKSRRRLSFYWPHPGLLCAATFGAWRMFGFWGASLIRQRRPAPQFFASSRLCALAFEKEVIAPWRSAQPFSFPSILHGSKKTDSTAPGLVVIFIICCVHFDGLGELARIFGFADGWPSAPSRFLLAARQKSRRRLNDATLTPGPCPGLLCCAPSRGLASVWSFGRGPYLFAAPPPACFASSRLGDQRNHLLFLLFFMVQKKR